MLGADTYRKRVRRLAGLFCVLGGLQLLIAATGALPESQLDPDTELGLYLSGAFLITGAIMVWNGSRAAAIAIVLWLSCDLAILLADGAGPGAIVRSLIYFSLAALMAWWAFRHVAAARGASEPVRGSRIVRWAGLAIVAPVLMLGAWGAVDQTTPQPVSERILAGRSIPSDQLAWMREQNFLFAGEVPLLFYSEGVQSIAEGGNLLTDRYIGAWSLDQDGEVGSAWARLGEICDILEVDDGAVTGIAIYTVMPPEEDEAFDFWLPVPDTRKADFLERLDYLNARHSNAEVTEACEESRPVDWMNFSRLNGFPPEILESGQVPARFLSWMRGRDFLMPGESIRWFHTAARHELEETGTLLSNAYFGGWYATDEGSIGAMWFEHGDICSLTEIEMEEATGFRRYRAESADAERWLEFELPSDDANRDRLIGDIELATMGAQTDDQAEACKTALAERDET